VPALAEDARFRTNSLRIQNRESLYELLIPVFPTKTKAEWVDGLTAQGVPCGPVNNIEEVFEDPQVQHRGMRIEMPHPASATGTVPLLGNPIKMSATPPAYDKPPPVLGQHTAEVLEELLVLDAPELARLREAGVIN
jgi:formyl-CoA transferase